LPLLLLLCWPPNSCLLLLPLFGFGRLLLLLSLRL
jgi:hypothetical protein